MSPLPFMPGQDVPNTLIFKKVVSSGGESFVFYIVGMEYLLDRKGERRLARVLPPDWGSLCERRANERRLATYALGLMGDESGKHGAMAARACPNPEGVQWPPTSG